MAELTELGKNACAAKYILQKLTTEEKNKALDTAANYLCDRQAEILAANESDLENGRRNGMNPGLLDRLKLTPDRIAQIAEGLRQISELPDCIGEVMEHFERPNGLKIDKVRVPLGVIGIIYEARPNVTADAFGLCFKTGNAVILKGGSDAIHSNIAIVRVLQDALDVCKMPRTAVQLIEDTDRAVTAQFMKMKEYVDVLIPRGGAGLIKAVVNQATIPVIETGTGNCHIFVDETADFDMAMDIILNAKTQRIGVCNACESLVIHEKIADTFLPELMKRLAEKNVEVHGDEKVMQIAGEGCMKRELLVPATEEDWGREYLDYKLSAKTVSSIDEAIAHINQYNTGHSEAIITNNYSNAEKFLNEIDAACVYVNASTRFTDGFEFGFGAEIGISTQKLHARGPMGLIALTSTKYIIYGNGQIRK